MVKGPTCLEDIKHAAKIIRGLKEKLPYGAVVCSPRDADALGKQLKDVTPRAPVPGALPVSFGLPILQHNYLPEGELLAFDTVERAQRFIAALDLLQAKGQDWRVAMALVMKETGEPPC